MNCYPIRFNPIYKEKVWGGRKLHTVLGKDAPADKPIGESWEIVDRGDNVSVVINGEYKDQTLRNLLKQYGEELLGTERSLDSFGRFPLMIKFLDATQRLSVQVHPGDDLVEKFRETDSGKSELWCVLHAKDGASIQYGCDDLLQTLDPQTTLTKEHEKLFHYIPVKRGDIISIPAGQVHALLSDCLVFEVQRNSDITYRLYDWGRIGIDGQPRDLHLQKGLQSIRLPQLETITSNIFDLNSNVNPLFKNDFFSVFYNNNSVPYHDICDGRSFKILAVIEGNGYISYDTAKKKLALNTGDVLLLPASMGEYIVKSDSEIHWLTVC